MKSAIPYYLFLTLIARLAHAQYCDASIGYPISDDASNPAPDPDSDCDAECQLYYSQQQTEYSNYFNDALEAGGNSFLSAAGGKRDLGHTPLSLLTRQSDTYLTCSSAETCFVYENIPLCINMDTGDFTDPTGGYGNVLTGTYTAAVDNNSSGGTTTTTSSSGSSSSGSSSGGSGSSPNGASSTHAGELTFGAVVLSAIFAFLAI
ncbi:hypothetical protein H2200_004787 [Cladophialophora chaetospira]|uniref:Uncharacterized protein n=1 Tax=Cladophialophora chaetospira TaxID=386627 RepID=A0AA38XDR9_9EURO|nr:hypothetical protein H2200_004787 [Cladophialophora chaetospira]